ncbi:hypothetical protein [Zhongshania sp.]|uniref:hypothetical protein n=1 Tax=Zhongshania sp. TaxID=1971902 RepID=UPI0035691590
MTAELRRFDEFAMTIDDLKKEIKALEKRNFARDMEARNADPRKDAFDKIVNEAVIDELAQEGRESELKTMEVVEGSRKDRRDVEKGLNDFFIRKATMIGMDPRDADNMMDFLIKKSEDPKQLSGMIRNALLSEDNARRMREEALLKSKGLDRAKDLMFGGIDDALSFMKTLGIVLGPVSKEDKKRLEDMSVEDFFSSIKEAQIADREADIKQGRFKPESIADLRKMQDVLLRE